MIKKYATPAELRAWRAEHHLTQTETADLLGYSLRAVQAWEGGERKMRRVLFEQLRARFEQTAPERR